jgi:hypothetical protein
MARAARKIPEGAWPRLLCAERAAAYLDVSVSTFMARIAPLLSAPMSVGARKLWDRQGIDARLDQLLQGDPAEMWLEAFDR